MKRRPHLVPMAVALAFGGCVINRTEAPPDSDGSGGTGAIRVVRSFACDPAGVSSPTAIADVAGRAGDEVVVSPTAEPCSLELGYRQSGVGVTRLSSVPGGYLLATAASDQSGALAVCASNIRHSAAAGTPQLSAGRLARRTDSVDIECAIYRDGSWSALTPVVTPDGEWAAWAGQVSPGDQPGRFSLKWVRDVSFQFLNTTEEGRPASDGVYETAFDMGPSGPRASSTKKTSDTAASSEGPRYWSGPANK
ncbi:MAG: hypothetical protein HYZ29_26755 [Myxococcales bacterium]|nr:hypothetical protein [Myxococcales bacterium]